MRYVHAGSSHLFTKKRSMLDSSDEILGWIVIIIFIVLIFGN